MKSRVHTFKIIFVGALDTVMHKSCFCELKNRVVEL